MTRKKTMVAVAANQFAYSNIYQYAQVLTGTEKPAND